MNANQVLKQMLLSEKSSKLSSELGQYTFEVFRYANKHAIAEAVEKTFKVTFPEDYFAKELAGNAEIRKAYLG